MSMYTQIPFKQNTALSLDPVEISPVVGQNTSGSYQDANHANIDFSDIYRGAESNPGMVT